MPESNDVRMTLNYILDRSVEQYAELPAIGMAAEDALTYQEFYDRIIALAHHLAGGGIKKGDRVAILSENSPNWGTAYFAIVRLGAIVVPILPDLPEADCHHILNEMEVPILFISQRQLEKVYELNQKKLRRIITLDDSVATQGVIEVTPFSVYLEEAFSAQEENKDIKKQAFTEVEEDDIASILYTSGTSGYSKAVMLSHKNLTANAYSAATMLEVDKGNVFLSVLPMSHTYEFTLGFLTPLIKGCKVAYAGKTPTPAILQKLCNHEKPTVMFTVPLIMEKIYKKRVLPQVEKSVLLSFLCRFSFGRKFVYKKIGARLLEFFGGKLEVMGIGGAALNPEVENFLQEAEFPYLIGYGLTESAPMLAGGPLGDPTIAVGSTGKPFPGVQIKIVDPDPDTGVGTIYGCGPNIMRGYYNDPDATADTITEDGWLNTGDLGYFDDSGNLYIRGRSKNVIVMANGENVYPEPIEHKINAYSWVVESLVVENNGKLDAWVYPDYEFIDDATKGKSRVKRREFIDKLCATMRKEVNAQVASSSRLARVVERREPFVKTATHKIKRYLYAGE
ncbi:AMP-binding protein [Desulfocapsa sp. AH-315-G09]|uniref:AMP-binding protein n=1 Tax=Desulfotalea psychrophila TaxID=84980 RepID=A0ABS3AU62_9BACT|nr:AMP-binding protein [Desulfocapsa sp.]MBN4065456.1 AMP-binding protein [Desulfocapsa sp. AH-315-G09]MBN4068172.1 AMP-binding protein [Desulfotalea psychrophila]